MLRLSDEAKRLLAKATNELFLGLIEADGLVHLIESDAESMPGHREWIGSTGIAAVGGFGVWFQHGSPRTLFNISEVNRTEEYGLPADVLAELLALIDPDDRCEVVSHDA